MKPFELELMIDQWARANAYTFGLRVQGVQVTAMGVADKNIVTEEGDKGGFFTMALASLHVTRPRIISVPLFLDRAEDNRIDEFERAYLQVCHDIWMKKDLAVRGRLIYREST